VAVTNEEKRLYALMNGAPNTGTSAEAQQAAAALRAGEQAAAQADYSTTADGKLDETISQYLNQNGYRYDINRDNAYREFAREHSQGAQRGRDLSIEGAQRLANGYTPSYADTVASEVYNEQAAKVGEYAPTFEKIAAQEAAAKQQSSGNLINLYSNMAQREYGRQRDVQGDRMNYLNYLANRYQGERELDAQRGSADTSVYTTQLNALADDLATARKVDAQRMQYDTQSAASRAKIAEDEYENAQKIAYNRAKDNYEDRIAAEKAAAKNEAKLLKQNASAAAKEKASAEKAARQHRINARKIMDLNAKAGDEGYDEAYSKLSAADKVDLDYNEDGKIDTIDLKQANNSAYEEDIKSGKGVKVEATKRADIFAKQIDHMASAAGSSPNKKLLEKQIKNSELTYPEQLYLYEYFSNKYGWE
jgi:hypothetical protein